MKPDNESRAKIRSHLRCVIGAAVRNRREELGMTQSQCSGLLAGAYESYWRNIEGGHKDISLIRLVEIADVLGVSASELIEGS